MGGTHMPQHTCEVRGQLLAHATMHMWGRRTTFGVNSLPPCFWPPIFLQEPVLGLQIAGGQIWLFKVGLRMETQVLAIQPFCQPYAMISYEDILIPISEGACGAMLFKEMVQGGQCFKDGAEIPLSSSFRAHSMLRFPLWNSLYLKHPYTICGVQKEFRHCCEWVNTRIFFIINSLIFNSSTFSP